jgi:NAD(P)-dependent dehydrogenase (short-subunit alcohol dehydrogenase family)
MILSLRNNGLKGKVVIIAAQRSGKCLPSELSQTFLTEEAIVYLTDINEEILKIAEEEVKHYTGQKVNTFPLDSERSGEIEKFIQDIKEKEGRIDVLITDFGLLEFIPHMKPFDLQTQEEWSRQLKYTLLDTFRWCKAIIPYMKDQNYGRIIHVNSEAGRVGTPYMSVYGAAKAAVAGFSRSLAAELARYNITVNCVSMGIQEIEKRDPSSQSSLSKLEKIRKIIPLRRFGEPEEISYMVALLASDLGGYITGQNISVAGGMVMT